VDVVCCKKNVQSNGQGLQGHKTQGDIENTQKKPPKTNPKEKKKTIKP
jgi:hypothetical protein